MRQLARLTLKLHEIENTKKNQSDFLEPQVFHCVRVWAWVRAWVRVRACMGAGACVCECVCARA